MSVHTALQEDVIIDTLQAKIDRFAELHLFLASYKKEYEQLKKEIAPEANLVQDDQKITLFGYQHKIEFSASDKKTIALVSNEELYKLYGLSVFKPEIPRIKSLEDSIKEGSVVNRKVKAFLKTHESAFGREWGSRKLIGAR